MHLDVVGHLAERVDAVQVEGLPYWYLVEFVHRRVAVVLDEFGERFVEEVDLVGGEDVVRDWVQGPLENPLWDLLAAEVVGPFLSEGLEDVCLPWRWSGPVATAGEAASVFEVASEGRVLKKSRAFISMKCPSMMVGL